MAYESCPMFGGYNLNGFYLNWIIIALIFAFIFWGAYYLMIKSKETRGKKRK